MLIALVVAFGGGVRLERAEAGPRPNFVIVLTDDQDVTSMEVMRKVRRYLTREGTRFENFYATLPACCPSRATLLTGQYAHNHGVQANERVDGGGFDRFRRSRAYSRTVAVALRRAGYRTGWVGKFLNGYGPVAMNTPSYRPPGWTNWQALAKPGGLYDWRLNDNGTLRSFRGARGYQTDVLARRAGGFIRRSAGLGRPFFLTVATGAPHGESGPDTWKRNPRPARRHWGAFSGEPLPRPPSFNAKPIDKPSFARRGPLSAERKRDLTRLNRSRRETLLAVDDMMGRLVRVLSRIGRLNNTYVIFTSDNGFLMGEHRLVGKRLLYEPSANVPMIIRGPGVPRGATRTQVTGNIDVASTILNAARVRPLIKQDGISLLGLARDRDRARNRGILLTHSQRAIGGRPGPPNWRSLGVRVPGWVYVRHNSNNGIEEELYDLNADPHQLRNLVPLTDRSNAEFDPALAQQRRELRERLKRLRDCAGKRCR